MVYTVYVLFFMLNVVNDSNIYFKNNYENHLQNYYK